MTEKEFEILKNIEINGAKHWVPCQWAQKLIVQARENNILHSDYFLFRLTNVFLSFNFFNSAFTT